MKPFLRNKVSIIILSNLQNFDCRIQYRVLTMRYVLETKQLIKINLIIVKNADN